MRKITIKQILYFLIAIVLLIPFAHISYKYATKNHYEYLTKGSRDLTEGLTQGVTILQEVPAQAGDLGLSFMFSNCGDKVSGEVTVRGIGKNSGIVYFEQMISGNEFKNNEFVDFYFSEGNMAQDETISVSFSATGDESAPLRLLTTDDDEIPDHTLIINGMEQPCDLFARRVLPPQNTFIYWTAFVFVLFFIPVFAWLLCFLKKVTNRYLVFFSVLVSVCFMLATRIVIGNGIFGNNDQNYVLDFDSLKSVLVGIIVFLLALTLFYFISCLYKKSIQCLCIDQTRQNTQRIRLGYLIVNIIAWIPYYLSYYPGGLYSDTIIAIDWHNRHVLTNRHPFLYTYLLGWFIRISQLLHKNLSWALGVFFLFQMIAGIIMLQFLLQKLLRFQINMKLIHLTMFFLIFDPLIPLFHASIWKDTPFALCFLYWLISYIEVLNETENQFITRSTIAHFLIGGVLVALTRNNGIYIVVVANLCIFAYLIRRKFLRKKSFYCFSILSLIAIILILGPIYSSLGIKKTDTIEKYGIPLQQISAVVANEGIISEEQKKILNDFIPVENIEKAFAPCIVDNLKWYSGFDHDYLEKHQKEFLRLWGELFIHNKKIYINEYLLQTVGFWNVGVSGEPAYVQTYVWSNPWHITQNDVFNKIFGFSFQKYVNPRNYVSCAWFIWIFIASAFFSMKHYGWEKIIYYIPQFLLWGTIMIATPIAWSLRYVEGLVFTAPFAFLIPVLLARKPNLGKRQNQ